MLISQPSSPGAMEDHEGFLQGDDPETRLRLAIDVNIDIRADIGVNADIEIGVGLYDVDVLAQMMLQ